MMKPAFGGEMEDSLGGSAAASAMDVDLDNDAPDFFDSTPDVPRPPLDADFFNAFEDDFDDSDIA